MKIKPHRFLFSLVLVFLRLPSPLYAESSDEAAKQHSGTADSSSRAVNGRRASWKIEPGPCEAFPLGQYDHSVSVPENTRSFSDDGSLAFAYSAPNWRALDLKTRKQYDLPSGSGHIEVLSDGHAAILFEKLDKEKAVKLVDDVRKPQNQPIELSVKGVPQVEFGKDFILVSGGGTASLYDSKHKSGHPERRREKPVTRRNREREAFGKKQRSAPSHQIRRRCENRSQISLFAKGNRPYSQCAYRTVLKGWHRGFRYY